MTRYNREDSRTVLPQLEEKITYSDTRIDEVNIRIDDVEERLDDVEYDVSVIGARQYRTDSYTKTSGTSFDDVRTSTVYVDLTPGVWIVHAMAKFDTNATGRRALRCYDNTTPGSISRSEANLPAISNANTRVHSMFTSKISATTKITLQAQQNSGDDTLNVTYYIEAVRIA